VEKRAKEEGPKRSKRDRIGKKIAGDAKE